MALCGAVAIAAAAQAQQAETAGAAQQKPASKLAAAAKAAAKPKADGKPKTKANPAAAQEQAEPQAPAILTEADLQRRAQPIVTYEGGEVTVGELEDAIANQSPFMRERYRDPKNLRELLDKTLRFELLAKEAERRKFDADDSVRQAVKQNAVQSLMKAEFDDKLSAASVPEEDIAKYYQEHIAEYEQPAMQRASHLMVATEQEAKELLKQAKDMDLRAFRQLARDKSMDEASKLRGGDLRYFDKEGKARGESIASVPLPIVRAAFALKDVGDTAPAPVKIEGGYSIVKLTGRRPAISRKLSEVADTIRVRLWRERRQEAIEAFVGELRTQYKPETHPQLAQAIELDDPKSAHEEPARGADEAPATEE